MAKVILHLTRWAVALVFIVAGALKIPAAQDFALAVQNYQLSSWTVSISIAIYLPWLEVIAALALLSGRLYRGALLILSALALLFLGAILSAWWRQLDISCGCFGSEFNRTNYPLHLLGNLTLLGAMLALIVAERRARLYAAPATP